MPLQTTIQPVIDHVKTGDYYRQLREKKHISLRELGKIVGLSPSYISDLERGLRKWDRDLAANFDRVLGRNKA